MGKGRKQFNRVLVYVLSIALALTGISFQWMPVMADEVTGTEDASERATSPVQPSRDGLIVYYDFVSQNDQAAMIPDASGNANNADIEAVSGGARGKYALIDANIYGRKVKALDLAGGEDGAYLCLPDELFNECEAVTISTWVKLSTDTGYQRIWDFGTGTTSYMYLLSDGGNEGFKGYASAVTTGGWSAEQGVQKGTNIAKNRWVLTTVVMDGSKMSLYENGELVGTNENTGITVSDLGNTTQNFVAYGQFGDAPTTGQFAEFMIYNRALTETEIKSMYNVTDDDILASDVYELDLGDISNVTEDMELPSEGVNGSSITWTSNDDAITIGELQDGTYAATVVRPNEGEANASVTLTATLTYNGKSDTKTFTATVIPEYSAQQIIEHDKEATVKAVGDLSAVIAKEITLPGKGEWGSDITWTWNGDNGVIAIPAQTNEDGNYIAAVTRPAIGSPDASGKLTATVTSGTESDTAEISVLIKAYRESISIKNTEEIKVNTLAGHSPSLPNYVMATYSDDSVDKLKVRWPDAIDAEKYATAGETFTVEGQIVGEYNKVTATVTVVSEEDIATAKTANFDLSDISLDKIGEDGSILTQNRDRDIVYLKLLDNKRMLYDFYMTFGENDKIANVKPLGGWDEPSGLLRGHSTGHYMSALALAYASTKDAELKTKLDEMVSELHRLQQKSKGNAKDFKISGSTMQDSLDVNTWSKDPNEWGEGFLSAYSPDQFALLEVYAPYGSPGTGIWAPYYTLHKLMAGFLDAYTYTGNTEALETAKALGKWVYNRLSACTQEQLTTMWGMYIAGELGGMNESMAQLYIYAKAGNDPDAEIYLKGAKLFDNTTFFNNLEKNIDDIKKRHANQHIPQVIGALEIYEATVDKGEAEQYYYDVAENFWQMVVSRYAYSIGGVGVGEAFSNEPYTQANNIRSDRNCETCAAYNMLKLTKMLNNYNPDDAEYMDYYERTLYNQILASQTPNVTDDMHNGTTYMLPIGPGTRRSYGEDYTSFTCCHGTGMENHVKYQEAAYAKTDDTLYVGLYLPSTVEWEEKGVKVIQETAFPSDSTKLTVAALGEGSTGTFDMKLRVPYWATNGFTVTVNDKEVIKEAEISTYVTLNGIKAGDVITVNMPWTLHLDKTPDKLGESMAASIMYGPFVMAAKNSSTEWQRLVLPEHLADVFQIGVNETNGFPTLSGSGYSFAPMFAPEYATEAYHTYFKVLVTADDGSVWHEVNVINNTPLNGTITTTAQAEMTKEGEDLTITLQPNEGYVVKKLLVNGEAVTVTNNTYVVKNVMDDVSIEVTFRPPTLNQNNLEYSADVSSDQWEPYYGQMTDIMTNWEPTSSISSGGKGWVNWWKAQGAEGYLQYTWDEAVTMNTFEVYWRVAYNGTDTDWMHVPGTIKVQYLGEDGEWKDANMTCKYEDIIALHQYNTISFDTITTTAVRLVTTIYDGENSEAGCTGVYRWKVSNKGSSVVDPVEVDKTKLAAAIAKAEALKQSEYTSATWSIMQTALAEAKAMNASADATQEQVDAAEEKLTGAIDALQKVPVVAGVDKTKLTEAIDKVASLNQSDYTEESWNNLQKALAAAKAVNESADVEQELVDKAEQDLTSAIAALEKVPVPADVDKTKLAAAIIKAESYKQDEYTETSWNNLQRALTNAKTVNASEDATQEQVNAAQSDLENAITNLTKKDTPVKPNPPASQESVKKLTDAIASAGTAYKKEDYTPESWNAFVAALEAARKAAADANATQAQIDTAQKNLTDAIAKLVKQQAEAPKPPVVKKSSLTLGVKETSKIYKKGYTYTTSNKKKVTVTKKGVIKGVKTGKATVTVKNASGQIVQIYTVTVKKAPSKISKVSPTKKKLKKGKTCKIKVTLPKGTASKITFTSSNKKVATVSAKGVVKAKKKGTATITVKTFNKKSKKVKITVK